MAFNFNRFLRDEGWFHKGKTVITFDIGEDEDAITYTITLFINGTLFSECTDSDGDIVEVWCYDNVTDTYFDKYVESIAKDGSVEFNLPDLDYAEECAVTGRDFYNYYSVLQCY